MTITFALLGLLAMEPLTGYDIKKKMQDIPFMYWSGNNNQIYKALVQLLDHGYVTHEIKHQDGTPSKKIYTITDKGKKALKDWIVTAEIELPEIKNTFLIQLAFSEQLNQQELEDLLSKYEKELQVQKLILAERKRRKQPHPGLSARGALLWEAAYDNHMLSCEKDLEWIQKVRTILNLGVE